MARVYPWVGAQVAKMNSPQLRLELLQYILGLDCRFTLDVLRATLHFALECAVRLQLPDMAPAATAEEDQAPTPADAEALPRGQQQLSGEQLPPTLGPRRKTR